MFGLGAGELVIFALVLVLLFGSKKIPELAQGVREAIRYMRGAFSDEKVNNQEK